MCFVVDAENQKLGVVPALVAGTHWLCGVW